MIDTDKYEGHTEGEWDLHSMGDGWTIGQLRKIDRTLMQDAPLLLTEVKRLREGIKKQIQFTLECVGSDIGDLYETIADDLRRLIE